MPEIDLQNSPEWRARDTRSNLLELYYLNKCILDIRNTIRYLDKNIVASRGAGARSVTVKPTGCEFELHSRR